MGKQIRHIKARHFKNKKKYKKFLAYEHIHGLEHEQGPYPETYISGEHVYPIHGE